MTWYPPAVRHPGPAWKQRGANRMSGFCGHSAEGFRAGLHHELGRIDRGSAWHFSIMRDGVVEQHYPITVALHHGGSVFANFNLVSAEHEGVAGQSLTKPQREASVALVRWLARERGWKLKRGETLFEHREVSDIATACPSGRIPWQDYVEAEEGYVDKDYTVIRPGEWLARVAERTGLAVSELVALNAITDPNKVEAWQVLRCNASVPVPDRPEGGWREGYAEAARFAATVLESQRVRLEALAAAPPARK